MKAKKPIKPTKAPAKTKKPTVLASANDYEVALGLQIDWRARGYKVEMKAYKVGKQTIFEIVEVK